ncbi:hypothetical protein Q1695_016318 [Nippostrongylus brasiliensis]|nr:hypothetical protein Q1695_016318 [Nippostrongylus brasiliensis]
MVSPKKGQPFIGNYGLAAIKRQEDQVWKVRRRSRQIRELHICWLRATSSLVSGSSTMSKIQSLQIIFIVATVTANSAFADGSGTSRQAICIVREYRTTTSLVPPTVVPSTVEPTLPEAVSLPTTVSSKVVVKPTRPEGECYEKPEWIHRLFAKYHNNTGLHMNCEYNKEAYWAAIPLLAYGINTVHKDYWCRIVHSEYVWGYFNEWRVEGYLKAYFPEKIKSIAKTYPGTQYGCTAMYNKYFFNFYQLVICIYSRLRSKDGTVAECPKGTE